MELVRFDMQLMENAEIKGVEYQQGELAGFEVKEYLLLKWGHDCVYKSKGHCNQYLQVEHITPRSRGGSNRISNLTISCQKHNQEKGALTAEEFGFPEIQSQAKRPLKDAAAVNTTRWALFERLKSLGLEVEAGSGGLTKFNRTQRELPKEHWVDAACVARSTPEKIEIDGIRPLKIKAMGHGTRQMCRMDKYGFPRTSAKSDRIVKGFKTGDMVKAKVLTGNKSGQHTGRVAVRKTGSFNITTKERTIQGINWKHCRRIHCCDGYGY